MEVTGFLSSTNLSSAITKRKKNVADQPLSWLKIQDPMQIWYTFHSVL